MKMKLQAKQGGAMRQHYTFFEIEALKYAFEHNLQPDEIFTFGKTDIEFRVLVNSDAEISVLRCDNEKIVEANKVERAARPPRPDESTPAGDDDAAPRGRAVEGTLGDGGQSVEEIAATFARMIASAQNEQKPATSPAEVDYEKISAMIDERLGAAQKFMVKVNDAPAVEVDGMAHEKFPEVMFWAANKQPVYLYGPAGTGKNVLAGQVAKAMNLPFYYAGSLQFKSDLEGFVDAGGNYVETDFYKAFTGGGVFLLDEIDGTAAEVLVAFGAALANRYYNFPKYGRVEAHEDFIVMAAGNTAGRGATEAYNGRYQLDASTLDRFAFVELDYDRRIELAAANNDSELVEFAHDLRRAINAAGLTYTVSTRALKRMAMGLQSGLPEQTIMRQAVCASWAQGDLQMIAAHVNNNNKYSQIFMEVAR